METVKKSKMTLNLTEGLLGNLENPDHRFNVAKVNHGAFALQGFNIKKILQRRYFDLDTDKTDLEIMDNFEIPNTLKVEELETRLNKYRDIHEKLLNYGARIATHTNKLFKIIYGASDPIELLHTPARPISEKANTLLSMYSSISRILADFISKVAEMVKKVTETIQQRYRDTFANRLKQARQEKKISQRVLSDLTSINRADIGLYETGKKFPSLDNFIKILRCTGISADWLLGMERI